MTNLLPLKNELDIDLKLEEIWKNFHTESYSPIAPLYPEQLRKNSITFLSLNPSLRPNSVEFATKGFYPHPPYPLVDCLKEKADYTFFQKFYDMGNMLELPWTVLDLLYERESIQKELEIKYNPKTISEKNKIFLHNQIKLTFEILESLNPKVVVISNSLTEKLIHSNLSDLELSQELPNAENGYIYRINQIPFITNESKFIGSRQHFIKSKNNGKRESLIQEIKRVIKSL